MLFRNAQNVLISQNLDSDNVHEHFVSFQESCCLNERRKIKIVQRKLI